METNLKIDFHGEVPIHGLREKIAERIARHEKRFGRITARRRFAVGRILEETTGAPNVVNGTL